MASPWWFKQFGTGWHDILKVTRDDDYNYIRGGGGNDIVIGGEGIDWLNGDGGNDRLYGRGGDDHLHGGWGDDYLDGGKGNDWLQDYEHATTYVFRPGDGFDIVSILKANDTIEFLMGDQDNGRFRFAEYTWSIENSWSGGPKEFKNTVIVYGDGGTDDGVVYNYYDDQVGGAGGGTIMLDGMSLARFKESGIGFTIRGGDGDNTLHGAFGRDKIYGGKGDDTLKGKRHDDELYGQDGDDTLYGGKGNDIMFGGAGNDYLGGGKNDDILWGGTGDDTLRGGFGNDRFSFRKGDGNDTIRDFGDDDMIQLDGIGHGFDGLTIVNNENGNAVVTYGDDTGGGTITLLDVTAESLSEDDFLFV